MIVPPPPLQGSKVVAEAIGRGGAKERRRVLKSMKGHALQLLTHRDAYLAVMRLVEVTDDTVALQKGVLAEVGAGRGGGAQRTNLALSFSISPHNLPHPPHLALRRDGQGDVCCQPVARGG